MEFIYFVLVHVLIENFELTEKLKLMIIKIFIICIKRVTKIKIIPNKIPGQIWERKNISDTILYALGVYGPINREEFINNREKGITNRMDKNTFHKWAKRLKTKKYIKVSRLHKKSLYAITNLGLNKLLKRLKSYKLDIDSIIEVEQRTLLKFMEQINRFLAPYGIKNSKILIEFLKLKKLITRDKLKSFSEDKLNNSILYLTLNHLKFYDDYVNIFISADEFIKKYSSTNLTKPELNWFLHKVVTQRACGITFYELNLDQMDINLYFRSTDEYGMIFEAVLQSVLKDIYYSENNLMKKSKQIILNEICEDILYILIHKYHLFHKNLESALYNLIKTYLIRIIKTLKKRDSLNYFHLQEITSLFLTSDVFLYDRLNYFQNKSLMHYKIANYEQTPVEFRNNVKSALEFINKAIDIDSRNSSNYAIKTKILKFIGKYDEALELITKAISLDPNVSDYYSDLAEILNWMDKYDESIDALKSAIELNPDVADYYSDLADTLSWINRNDEAIDLIDKAIELDPKRIQFYIQKSSFLAFDLKKFKTALEVIEKAFELNPREISQFELYRQKASVLLCMKNRDAALKVIQKTRKLFPQKEIYPNLKF